MTRIFAVVMGALLTVPALAADQKPTFTTDVAPIFYSKCVSCHRPGEIAPFSLLDYTTARAWAKSIRKAVHERVMPPWHADSSLVDYKNDPSLSEEDIATILAWVDAGAPQGNPDSLPKPPGFHETWAMGEPDLIFHAERDFAIPALEQEIPYQSIWFKTDISEDLYIQEWEIRPMHRKAVHHANLIRSPERAPHVGIGTAVSQGGDYIGSYLPGARPFSYPEGTALIIPKGSQIGIQVHYVGQDEPLTDHVMFGVKFAQGRIDKIVRTVGTDDYEMVIEPGDADFTLDAEVELHYDMTIFSSGAHMHLRGDAYKATAILPNGEETLITSVPNYDFNWQSNYELANPILVPKGTKYHIWARWDNSAANPNNPDPAQKVVYGPWTENEMLTTWSHVVLTHERLGLKVKDGRVIGKFEDASNEPHPFLLQTLPNTFNRGASKSDSTD